MRQVSCVVLYVDADGGGSIRDTSESIMQLGLILLTGDTPESIMQLDLVLIRGMSVSIMQLSLTLSLSHASVSSLGVHKTNFECPRCSIFCLFLPVPSPSYLLPLKQVFFSVI